MPLSGSSRDCDPNSRARPIPTMFDNLSHRRDAAAVEISDGSRDRAGSGMVMRDAAIAYELMGARRSSSAAAQSAQAFVGRAESTTDVKIAAGFRVSGLLLTAPANELKKGREPWPITT